MKSAIIVSILLLVAANTTAQNGGLNETGEWSFKHYPAAAQFKGRPAKPLLVTPHDHKYRTQILTQARKGPNFAGHFTLAKWGCGGNLCVDFVIINARSGAIYDPNILVGCSDLKTRGEAGMEFKVTSRLLIATGFSDELGCGEAYYEWNGKRLKLIHFEPWPKPSA